MKCLKVPHKVGDHFGRALCRLSALFAKKFIRDAVDNNTEFGLCFEEVTIMHGDQGLAERILEPELTIPRGILVWVRKGCIRRFSDQGRFEEVIAKGTEICVSNKLLSYLERGFYLPLKVEKTPKCEIAG